MGSQKAQIMQSVLRRVPLRVGQQLRKSTAVRCLATPSLDSEAEKCLYTIGINCGRQMGELKCLSDDELDRVLLGMKDVITGTDFKVELESYMPKAAKMFESKQQEAADKAIAAGLSALVEAANEKGAVKTDSGLVFLETQTGEGDAPHWKDKVKVHYEGRLVDGTVFDSSIQRGEPIEFALGGVIRGWTEGLQLMKPGSKAKLTIPADMAYGDGGQGPIPGKAVLVFDVELIAIV